MGTIRNDLTQWLHRPFRADMDLLSLTLAIGTVLVIIAFWVMILRHVDVNLE